MENVDAVDFTLPPLDPRTTVRLGVVPAASGFEVYLGAPAWASKAWTGEIYPAGAKRADFLRLYAERFNCIELNLTHYRTPSEADVQRWIEETPSTFRFCPKVPQEISHRRRLQNCELESDLFFKSGLGLGSRLGCVFLQLSPQFAPGDLPLLRAWLARVPQQIEIAVEFRHPGFFQRGALLASAYDVLERAHAQTVITDVAGRRDVLHASLTGPTLFLRLILNDLHPSDFLRSQAWAERVAVWKTQGLTRAYLIAHQPLDVAAPKFATHWARELNVALGVDLKGPLDAPLAPTTGEQLGFFSE